MKPEQGSEGSGIRFNSRETDLCGYTFIPQDCIRAAVEELRARGQSHIDGSIVAGVEQEFDLHFGCSDGASKYSVLNFNTGVDLNMLARRLAEYAPPVAEVGELPSVPDDLTDL